MNGLAGKTVLLTRSHDANAELALLLAKRQAGTISLPTMRFIEPESWEACDAAIINLRQYDGILFTSRNAVAAFVGRVRNLQPDAEVLLKSRALYAVGEKTEEALLSEGLPVAGTPDLASSEELGELLGGGEIAGKRFLFPKSNIARDVLPNALRAFDAVVDEVVVYRNLPPDGKELDAMRDALAGHRIDAVMFFSPSAIRNFIQLLGTKHLDQPVIAVIGQTTAQAATDLGIAVDVVAPQSTAESLVEALDQHLTSHAYRS